MFVDISFPRQYLPSSLYRYIPNMTRCDDPNLNVLGIVTLADLEDDTELFVDYWNVYTFDLKTIPDWMTIPPDNLGKMFVKREYEYAFPLAMEMAREVFAPDAVLNRLDLQRILKSEIRELMSPVIVEQKRLLEEFEAKKALENKSKV